MKKKLLPLLALSATLLAGCHTCPGPDDPNYMECYPVCKEVYEENVEDIRAKWESFQQVAIYVPGQTAYPALDNITMMVAKLSHQVKNEIVVPYINLDKEGLISYYMEFGLAVQAVMEQQKCTQAEAVTLVYNQWKGTPEGKEKFNKFMAALPILERLEQQQNIFVVLAKIAPELATLALNIKEVKNNAKDIVNDGKNALTDPAAAARVLGATNEITLALNNISTMTEAIAFLNIYNGELRSQREAIEEHIKKLEETYDADHK